MKKYLMILPLLMAFLLAGCSDDDNYQPADPVKADCQQVHFSGDNEETILLDPSSADGFSTRLKVVRNTTSGSLNVPVTKNAKTAEGITGDSVVTFADGDSVAYLTVHFPDTAKSGQSYPFSFTLVSDEVDPYTYLDGGQTFEGKASVPEEVKIKCWIAQQLTEPWEETALDLGGGTYRITDFMHSGYALILNVSNGVLDVSVPADSPLYQDAASYGTLIYWFTDDYVHLYPYGKDSVDVTDFVILNGASYNMYYPQSKNGYFYLMEFQTSTMANPASWCYFCFKIEK